VRALLVSVVVVGLLFTARPDARQMLGGKPAPLSTSYKSEHEWAVRESVDDIIEMAATVRGSGVAQDHRVARRAVHGAIAGVQRDGAADLPVARLDAAV